MKMKLGLVGAAVLGFALACSSGSDKDDLECTTSTGEECDPDTFSDTGETCTCVEPSDTAEESDADADADADTDTDTDTDTDISPWTANSSPCSGSKMDALYCTSESDCYVGCGTNAEGVGLHVTDDGGASWDVAEDAYDGTFFTTFRVTDIDDAGGGELYVSGTTTDGGGYRVVTFDPSSGSLDEVYTNIATTDYSMTVGNFAEDSSGVQIAESLTGTGLLVRKTNDATFMADYSDTDGWASAYGWWNTAGFSSHNQVLDLAVVDDQFVGVGAQINQPPVVYLPPRSWTLGTSSNSDDYVDQMFEVVQLASGFEEYDGECWGIDGNDDGLAVVCVNQDADEGRIYTIGDSWQTDAYDAGNWSVTYSEDIVAAALVDGHSTWNEGVCRGSSNRIAVVGRDSQTDDGYVIYSSDGGSSWAELTEDIVAAYGSDLSPVTRCMFTGSHLVVGGSGLYAYVALSDL